MTRLLDIFHAPTKVFTSLKEKPEWVTPFVIVLIVVALSAALTVSMTRETVMAQQEEILRERGVEEEQIERAMQFASGPVAMITSTIIAPIMIALMLLVFAAILNLFIPLFGGKGAFKPVFSVVCFSSLIKVPGAILRLILIIITKSPYVTASLALFAPTLAKTSFSYRLLAGVDFFIIWEMILVALGIAITSEVRKNNAYVLVFIIWIASVFIGAGLGMFGPRG